MSASNQTALADYHDTTRDDAMVDVEPTTDHEDEHDDGLPRGRLSFSEVEAEIKAFVESGRAPRLDLDLDRECTEGTVRELIRRKWGVAEIADYCRVDETEVREKLATLDVGPHKSHGTPSQVGASQVLWFTHPSQVPAE